MTGLHLNPRLLETSQTEPASIARQWFSDARHQEDWHDSLALATAGTDGHVSCRVVTAQILEDGKTLFASSERTRKAQQLRANPCAAMLAFWPRHERQLRIEGSVKRASTAKADQLFAELPREAQLLAWASADGQPQTPDEYDREHARFDDKYRDRQFPRPSYWRAFILTPAAYEFWESRGNWRRTCVRYILDDQGNWHYNFVGP